MMFKNLGILENDGMWQVVNIPNITNGKTIKLRLAKDGRSNYLSRDILTAIW